MLHYFHEFLERGEGEGGLEVKLHVWCWEGCCEQVSDKSPRSIFLSTDLLNGIMVIDFLVFFSRISFSHLT